MAEEQKKSKRWCGYVLIAAAILLAVISVYMFRQTWGINLLYENVALGRIYRFYWIPLLVAAVMAMFGKLLLKKYPKPVKQKENTNAGNTKCSNCGAKLPVGAAFCGACGMPVANTDEVEKTDEPQVECADENSQEEKTQEETKE